MSTEGVGSEIVPNNEAIFYVLLKHSINKCIQNCKENLSQHVVYLFIIISLVCMKQLNRQCS